MLKPARRPDMMLVLSLLTLFGVVVTTAIQAGEWPDDRVEQSAPAPSEAAWLLPTEGVRGSRLPFFGQRRMQSMNFLLQVGTRVDGESWAIHLGGREVPVAMDAEDADYAIFGMNWRW